MRNTHGLDVMATSIEVRLSVPRTGISVPHFTHFIDLNQIVSV